MASAVTRCGLDQDVDQDHPAGERGGHRDRSARRWWRENGNFPRRGSRGEVRVGGGVAASILRLGSARERGCDDTLIAVRVGSLGDGAA